MGNGNIREIVDSMSEDEKMKYLIQSGKVNDQLIQLYRDEVMAPNEIYEYVVGKRIEQLNTTIKIIKNYTNSNLHK